MTGSCKNMCKHFSFWAKGWPATLQQEKRHFHEMCYIPSYSVFSLHYHEVCYIPSYSVFSLHYHEVCYIPSYSVFSLHYHDVCYIPSYSVTPPPPPTLHKITNDTGHGGQCCKLPSQTETTTVSNANLFIIYFIITQNRTVSTNGTHLLHGVYSTVNHMSRVLYVHDSLITPSKPSIIDAP